MSLRRREQLIQFLTTPEFSHRMRHAGVKVHFLPLDDLEREQAPDGIHPGVEGHKILGAQLARELGGLL
jgi:hypothetical protein